MTLAGADGRTPIDALALHASGSVRLGRVLYQVRPLVDVRHALWARPTAVDGLAWLRANGLRSVTPAEGEAFRRALGPRIVEPFGLPDAELCRRAGVDPKSETAKQALRTRDMGTLEWSRYFDLGTVQTTDVDPARGELDARPVLFMKFWMELLGSLFGFYSAVDVHALGSDRHGPGWLQQGGHVSHSGGRHHDYATGIWACAEAPAHGWFSFEPDDKETPTDPSAVAHGPLIPEHDWSVLHDTEPPTPARAITRPTAATSAGAPAPNAVDRDPEIVQGIDVSQHQGAIDWPKVAAFGIRVALVKFTEGIGYVDQAAARNAKGARDAGVPDVGAYHYLRVRAGRQDARQQCEEHLVACEHLGVTIASALDVETEGNEGRKVHEYLDAIREWVATYVAATGRKPWLYTYPGLWAAYSELRGAIDLGELPLHVAHYTGALRPTVPLPWTDWSAWQYAAGAGVVGRVPGVSGPCDRNRYRRAAIEAARL